MISRRDSLDSGPVDLEFELEDVTRSFFVSTLGASSVIIEKLCAYTLRDITIKNNKFLRTRNKILRMVSFVLQSYIELFFLIVCKKLNILNS